MAKKKPDPLVSARGTCGSCRHYFTRDDTCRRFPPIVVVCCDENDNEAPMTFFPSCDPEDFCGEFAPIN